MNSEEQSTLRVAVVVLAAGSGSRFGHSTNKVWLPLDDRKIITHSLINAAGSFKYPRVVLVINALDEDVAKEVLANEVPELAVELVIGGATRHESEYSALMHLEKEIENDLIDVILIHDGARPLATDKLFRHIAMTAFENGGALPAIAVSPYELEMVVPREVVRVQTPQAFRAKEVLAAYRLSLVDNFIGTDTAACMEKYFPNVKSVAVRGELHNIKITFSQDLMVARNILSKMQNGLK